MSYTKRQDTPSQAIDAAIEAIAAVGTYAAAAGVLGITTGAFKQWRDADEFLSARCEKAKARRWENHDFVKRTLAEAHATKTLREGVVETTEIEKEIIDSNGEPHTVTEIKVVRKGPPLRLVERYLGHPEVEEFAIIKMLVLAGHLPESSLALFENALFQFKQSVTDLISPQGEESAIARVPQEQLIDAATRAIQRVFTQDAAAISAEVVSRPEPSKDS